MTGVHQCFANLKVPDLCQRSEGLSLLYSPGFTAAARPEDSDRFQGEGCGPRLLSVTEHTP